MIVKMVMAITVASRWRVTHLSEELKVTPRPALTGGTGGTGVRSLEVLTAACATN